MHLVKIPMTSDRKKCGIPELQKNITTTKVKQKDGTEITQTFKEEIIHYDDNGFIIGVTRIWQ